MPPDSASATTVVTAGAALGRNGKFNRAVACCGIGLPPLAVGLAKQCPLPRGSRIWLIDDGGSSMAFSFWPRILLSGSPLPPWPWQRLDGGISFFYGI